MEQLTTIEKVVLCANHNWKCCRLDSDGIYIVAIENEPSNPENHGEYINALLVNDYDFEQELETYNNS